MEERVEAGMTDNQWDGMIKMFLMMVCESESREQIAQKLKFLLRNSTDFDAIMQEFEKGTGQRKG